MPILLRTMENRACSATRQSSDTVEGALGGGWRGGRANLGPRIRGGLQFKSDFLRNWSIVCGKMDELNFTIRWGFVGG